MTTDVQDPVSNEQTTEPTIDDLKARLEALEGMKGKAVDESKAERDKRKALEARVQQFEEAERKRAEDEARKAGEWDKLKQQTEAEKSALKTKVETMQRDLVLKDALGTLPILPALKAAAEARIKPLIELDSDGNATISGQPVSDWMKEWSTSDEGKAFVSNGSSGGGANGGSGNSNGGQTKKPSEMTATEEAAYLNAARLKGPDAYQKARQEFGYS